MLEAGADIHERISERVRECRNSRGLSLDALAAQSGVSRSMISLIERGESSPTAVVLDKLAVALGVTLASLFDSRSTAAAQKAPVSRRGDQPEWRDPDSGYCRRNVSPSWVSQPMQIVEVRFPPRARVAFESSDPRTHQQIWLLHGSIDVTQGSERYRLRTGDCLAMQLDRPAVFHNPTTKAARYAVVVTTQPTAAGR
ncbi:MAG TPA: XRE family transcriptional regulator [Polyangiaceae bacterium]|nr:XRE family transcriptional regulator [Polyangiaceae bacterium]